MSARAGKPDVYWEDAAILMAWSLQQFREYDPTGTLETTFDIVEADITMAKDAKSPASIQTCLIITLDGKPVGFDDEAVPFADVAPPPHIDFFFTRTRRRSPRTLGEASRIR